VAGGGLPNPVWYDKVYLHADDVRSDKDRVTDVFAVKCTLPAAVAALKWTRQLSGR
jgi:hypothetical protein